MSSIEKRLSGTIRKNFSDLQTAYIAWNTYQASQQQNLQAFFQVARVCEHELCNMDFDECNFPKKFIEELLLYISECLRIFDNNLRSETTTHELLQVLDYFNPFLKILYYILPVPGFKLDEGIIEKIMIVAESIKQFEIERIENEGILKFLFLVCQTLFLATLMRREKSGKNKTLNLVFHLFQSLLTDLINEPKLNKVSIKPFELPRSKFNPDISPVDLTYYLVYLLNQLAKLNPSLSMHYLVIHILPKLIDNLLLILKFKQIQKSKKSFLAAHKSFQIFTLLHTVSCLNSKEELSENILEDHSENIKELFYCTISTYMKHYWSVNSSNDHECEFIAHFLRIFFDIFPQKATKPSLNFLPIEMFAKLLTAETQQELISHPPLAQSLILQFIETILSRLSKQKINPHRLSETKIAYIMFSRPFFEIENERNEYSANLSESARLSWRKIWNDIMGSPNIAWISESLVKSLRIYDGNVNYLLKISYFVREEFERKNSLMKLCLLNGLLDALMQKTLILKRAGENEGFSAFFSIISSILDLNGPDEIKNSSFLLETLLSEEFLLDEACCDQTLVCCSKLLKYQDKSCHLKVKQILDNTTNPNLLLKLCDSIQDSLKDLADNHAIQIKFAETGIIRTFQNKLCNSIAFLDEIVSKVWEKIFECIWMIINKNSEARKYMADFQVHKIILTLRNPLFCEKQKEICNKIFDILLGILCGNMNFDESQFTGIYTAEVIPLIIEFLVGSLDTKPIEKYSKIILRLLSNPINAAQFAMRQTTAILLESLSFPHKEETIKFCANVLSRIIQHHVTPNELRKIIEIAILSHNSTKAIICKSMAKAATFCYQSQINHGVSDPSRYFNFRQNWGELACELPKPTVILPKKEFTIFMWIFFDNLTDSIIFELSESKDTRFTIYLNKEKLSVKYKAQETWFKLKCPHDIVLNQWNLIGVGMRKISKVFGSKDEIYVNVNRHCMHLNKECKGNLSFIHASFRQISCGKSTWSRKKEFNGKCTGFYIANKCFLENFYMQLYELSCNYNFDFCPEASATYTNFIPNKILLSEISKTLVLKWTSKQSVPESDFDFKISKKECDIFNGISLFEAIVANGGLKIFLPLFTEQTFTTSQPFNVFDCIFVMKSLDNVIDEDFFETLGHVLERSIINPNEILLQSIANIIDKLEFNPEYQFKCIKSILLNDKIWRTLPRELTESYFKALIKYIPLNFHNKKNDITHICSYLIKFTNWEFYQELILEILEKTLIATKTKCRYRSIAQLIIFIISKTNNHDFMSTFLDHLYYKKIVTSFSAKICYAMLHLLENFKDSSIIQSKALRLIFSFPFVAGAVNFSEVFEIVSNKFEANIDYETSMILIDIFVNSNLRESGYLADLITRKICQSPEIGRIISALTNSCENLKVRHILHDRPNFPEWVVECANSESAESIESLVITIFCNKTYMKNFNKLKEVTKLLSSTILSSRLFYIYFVILEYYNSSQGFIEKSELYIDFISVLEDSIPYFDSSIYEEMYTHTLSKIYQIAVDNNFLSCTYPYLPKINFNALFFLYKQRIDEQIISISSSYLKEGGVLRIILNLALIGLAYGENEKSLEIIEELSFKDIRINKEWEKKLASTKRYTEILRDFPKENDEFSSRVFIVFYIVAEMTEIIRFREQKQYSTSIMLQSLRRIINKTKIGDMIQEVASIYGLESIGYFNELLTQFSECFYSSTLFQIHRGIFPYGEIKRERTASTASTKSANSTENAIQNSFTKPIIDQIYTLNISSTSENTLLSLLCSEEWNRKVQSFLLSYTSLKLNLIQNCLSKYTFADPPAAFFNRDEAATHAEHYIIKKEKVIEAIPENLTEKSIKIELKYKEFLKSLKANMANTKEEQNYDMKIYPVLDKIGRQSFLKPSFKRSSRLAGKNNSVSPTFDASMFKSLSVMVGGYASSEHKFSPRPEGLEGFELSEEYAELKINEEEDENEPTPRSTVTNTITATSEWNSPYTEIFECERIKVDGSYLGVIEITSDFLLFESEGKEKDDESIYEGSSPICNQLATQKSILFESRDIKEVYGRRFMHRYSAIEFFLKSGKSYYFNLFTEENKTQAFRVMKIWERQGAKLYPKLSHEKLKKYKTWWCEGKISNFQYLMILNKMSSRSFNEISQYPIFPWVCKDFTSDKLDLTDKNIYRDLSYPVGAQTDDLRSQARSRYEQWKDEEIQAFHYGSLYSCGGIVCYYNLRIEPFTAVAICLQGGSFDIPDRLFYSFQSAWDSCKSSCGDSKELIPEMFYLPEVLININHKKFGKRQGNGGEVSDVELPPWASSPIDFIRKHRQILESNAVSLNLHLWIDLIFGCKQKGKNAEKALNVYLGTAYEESLTKFDSSNMTKHEKRPLYEGIYHFGQVPVQLFTKSHPKRVLKEKPLSVFDKYNDFTLHPCINSRAEITGKVYAIFTTQKFLLAVKAIENNKKWFLVKIKWKQDQNELRIDSSSSKECELKDFRPLNIENWEEKYQWNHILSTLDIRILLDRGPNQFCLWNNDLLVSGFHIDNSFKIHNFDGILIKSIYHHCGLIICLASSNRLLFTGSLDSTICLWKPFKSIQSRIKPRNIYFGHSDPIKMISVSISYQALVSLSMCGAVLLHNIRTGECIKRILKSCEKPPRAIAISEIGVIAVSFPEQHLVKIYTINGQHYMDDYRLKCEEVWCMQYNKSGDYLITGSDYGVSFFDTIDKSENNKNVRKSGIKDVFTTVISLCVPTNEEFIIFSINLENSSRISTFELLPPNQKKTSMKQVHVLA
ncbi:NBEAL1_4 [Blepharisma stoltei]|uniref:BEACH domain-containing protein n=1 Tax=Blepharisma stoltei TaxID=1481888 RepID=A0AAU9JGE1_9CILI|nr:unnamed protein product [Blepharisma stoltei]